MCDAEGSSSPKSLSEWCEFAALLDWDVVTVSLAERFHWHPNLVLDETPIARLWPFLGFKKQPEPFGRDQLRERVNRQRARRGMPPLPPKADKKRR